MNSRVVRLVVKEQEGVIKGKVVEVQNGQEGDTIYVSPYAGPNKEFVIEKLENFCDLIGCKDRQLSC